MQIHLTLQAEDKIVLPYNYQYYLQSLIYHSLYDNPGYACMLHDHGFASGQKNFKLFCFSPLFGQMQSSSDMLIFDGSINLEIRSYDPLFIQNLLYTLQVGDRVNLKGQQLSISRVKLQNRRIFADKITVKMISPLTCYHTVDKHTIYCTPGDLDFYEMVNSNFYNKYKAATGREPDSRILFTPLYVHPQKDSRLVIYKSYYIKGWRGTYQLQGEPEYLDFLYNTGLGAKNAQGFGFFGIASEKNRY